MEQFWAPLKIIMLVYACFKINQSGLDNFVGSL